MKVALVYDRVNKWGGAERVLLSLHEIFPEAPLYTAVYDRKKASWAHVFHVIPSFLQKLPFATAHHDWYPFFMPLAFESFSFDEYDLVISVTSESAKGIIVKPPTKHICICLTPTRYLWTGYHEYFKNPLFRFFTKPVVFYLRIWDKVAAQRPDAFIAISHEVKKRIKKFYGRDSQVIYPAVDLGRTKDEIAAPVPRIRVTSKSKIHGLIRNDNREQKPYFLVVSRLVPYKRVDLAIKACNALHLPLKIIGTGSEEKRLRAIAGPTIEFLKNLTDDTLVLYYIGCYCLLFPGHEDLGLSIIEAQKFGKPVIAYKAGGALETIIEGKTGNFFYPQTIPALVHALQEFTKENETLTEKQLEKKYKKACQEQAEKFNQETFEKELQQFIKKVIQ